MLTEEQELKNIEEMTLILEPFIGKVINENMIDDMTCELCYYIRNGKRFNINDFWDTVRSLNQ